MARKPTTNPASTSRRQSLTVSDTLTAPIIYFDGTSNLGASNGVVTLTLAADRQTIRDDAVVVDVVAVAFLRCTLSTAVNLRDSIDKALLIAAPPAGGTN